MSTTATAAGAGAGEAAVSVIAVAAAAAAGDLPRGMVFADRPISLGRAGGEGGGTRGDTLIASMTGAFDSLSPALQQMLTGMTARHGVQDLMNSYGEEPDP